MSSNHLLLHFPGHHGNFLSRMFDFASGRLEHFDVFNSVTGTAHANRHYPHQTFTTCCPGELKGEYDDEYYPTGKDVTITFNSKMFAFETVYFLFKANRDRGIDLLDDDQLHLATNLTVDRRENRNLLVDPAAFENHWDWLVYQFHVVDFLCQRQLVLDRHFSVHWIYGDDFEKHLGDLLAWYGLEQRHSVTEHHQKFLELRQPMLEAKGSTGSMFQEAYLAWQKSKRITIDVDILGPRLKHLYKNH